MESKTTRIILIAVISIFIVGGAFSGGVIVGWLIPSQVRPAAIFGPASTQDEATANQSVSSTTQPTATADTTTLFKPFWDAWALVHQQYVDQPVNDQTLMRGAITGMINALGDPHSSYWDPTVYAKATAQLNGDSYEGIGAFVDTTGEFLKIISPMPDSPAMKAGLQSGDLIIAVDKKDMTGNPGDVVRKQLLGPVGTNVILTIQREGVPQPFDVTITRAKITIPQAEGKMLDNNVAYVRLYTFGDLTEPELRKYLEELLPQKPVGLILDLRNNGGGYLDSAINVVSEFIKSPDVVMYEQYGDGTRNTYTAKPDGLATDIPLVVLVNKGTASASEITAGAIQDYGRGTLVGVKTYGKGSVQQITQLKNDGGAVRITVARWLTPKERQINGVGLEPDAVVSLTQDDITNNRDPQLDKAVEILTSAAK
jgi:carboxyl-terminal processing protease